MTALPEPVRRIVLGVDHRVLRTAAAELNVALGTDLDLVVAGVPGVGDAVLALASDPLVQPLIRCGRTNLHNQAVGRDAFHLFTDAGILWVLGASERGVLQGVNQLTCPSAPTTPAANLDLSASFAFSHRLFSPILGRHLLAPGTSPAALRSCMRYLSRMGASHLAATHDFAGGPSRDLHAYVETSVFPQATDPEQCQALRAALRGAIDAAREYGLDILFDSRLIPCQGGPWVPEAERQKFLRRFPPQVLSDSGTYQGKVLCFGHGLVRDFFVEGIERFFAAFPEVDTFHYLTMDAEGEFCEPHTCPRCRGLSKFDQRDRLAHFLEATMSRARPGIRILNTSFQWDRVGLGFGQLLARQAALPAAVGLCLPATGDAATFERQSHDLLRQARAVTHRAGQLAVGRDALHAFEDWYYTAPQRFDYPLGVFAKIRRWNDLGFDGFYDVRGRLSPDDLHANSLACRAALLDPASDAGAFVDGLAGRWFGTEAGPLVATAWRRLDQAQTIRSNGFAFPSSSALSEYVPWHFGKACTPLPTDPRFTAQAPVQAAANHGELPPAPANGYVYRDGDYPMCLRTSGQSLVEAATLCAEAVAWLERARRLALPERLADAEHWLVDAPPTSPREYLDEHLAFLIHQQRFWAVMGPYFILKALRIERGDDTRAFQRDATPWLMAYAEAAGALADHLEQQLAGGRLRGALPECMAPTTLRARAREVRESLGAGAGAYQRATLSTIPFPTE